MILIKHVPSFSYLHSFSIKQFLEHYFDIARTLPHFLSIYAYYEGMSARISSTSIILILVSLGIGALGGYYFQNNQNKQILNSHLTTINTQKDLLSMKDQSLFEYEQNTQAYNETITNQEQEISNLNNELSTLIEAQQNEPDIINQQKDQIEDLEDEIQERKNEVISLKSRLGDRYNWKSYSKHEVSFEYPDWMDLSILDDGYNLGTVLSINWINPVNYFSYSWQNLDSLEEMLEDVEEEHETLVLDTKNIVETEVNGHDAYLYFYNVTVGDGYYHGMLCVWECSNTNRFNMLFQYSSGDPYSSLLEILSTVKCHTEGDPV